MYTCIRFTIDSFLMLKIMFNIIHWYRTFQISHNSSSEVFRNQNCWSSPRWVAQEIWSGTTRKKKRVSFLKFWSWWTKRNLAEHLPWKEMCVWVYTVCVFFGGVVNAGWFMRSKSSRENSPVWEMLPETMWEAHRPCFLQIVGFQPSKDLHLGLPRYMYVYIHIFTLCNIA